MVKGIVMIQFWMLGQACTKSARNFIMKWKFLPFQDARFKTIILRRTLAPEYDQDFVFQEVPTDSLEKKSLM